MMKQAVLLLLIGLAVLRAMPQTNEDVHVEDTPAEFSTSDSTRRSGCSSYRGPHACNKDDGCKWAAGHHVPSRGNGESCTKWWCSGVCFNPCSATVLTADFTSTGITATVEVTQSSSDLASERAQWTANFEEFDSNLCPSGQLNWHVHQTPGSGLGQNDCGSAVTGGHYDPTFACGGASQNNGVSVGEALDEADTDLKTFPNAPFPTVDPPSIPSICTFLRAVAGQKPYADVCGPASQTNCEIGDQSAKMGKLRTTPGEQSFTDSFMMDITKLKGRSLVLHCCDDASRCSQRIACANLQ